MGLKLLDLHIIRVDSIWDNRPVEGIVPMNTAYWTVDREMDRYERKLLEGTVHAVPLAYSERNYMPLDPGTPNPKLFVGHDAIQFQRNIGRKDWGREKYHPGLKEVFEYQTVAEYGAMIDLQVGEKVYFHPSVTEEENLLEKTDKYSLYMASVDQLICGVGWVPDPIGSEKPLEMREIRPQGGFVLIEPIIDTQVESDGIVFRQEGEAVLLQGVVRHARPGSGLVEGEHIYYETDSDWVFKVEGVVYYAMREENVLGRKAA